MNLLNKISNPSTGTALVAALLCATLAVTSIAADTPAANSGSEAGGQAAEGETAETGTHLVPFVMPMLQPPGEQLDMRRVFLGQPRGENLPRVTVRDGHFFAGDSRVRFWGVNLCFGACFPEHEVADKLAARLAGFGINAVRLHHMDYRSFPDGIWKKDFSGLSPEALDRLDYLLAAFKREGIYVNMNLHVSRDFSRTGSDFSSERMPQFGKVVGTFHPQLIELQKQYARDLLTHRNAYTGLTYAEDPVIAIVEISNENSAYLALSGYAALGLDAEFEKVLADLWNQWLAERYEDDAALRAAWSKGSVPKGPEMLRGGAQPGAETLEQHWLVRPLEGAAMEVLPMSTPRPAADEPASAEPCHLLAINIQKITDVSWHLQLMQPGLKLEKGRFYTVRFRARAEESRSISIGVQQHDDPYHNLGLASEVPLDDKWRFYELGFRATADEDNGRLTFVLGKSDAAVYLTDLSMTPGGRQGLREGESLARGNIRRTMRHDVTSPSRAADFARFLAHLDAEFFGGMRRYLREELGVQAAITGGETFTLTGDYIHAREMDLVAAHSYWDHPSFPRRPWDPRDWLIRNQPMVDRPGNPESTIARLTHDRFIRASADGPDRPFSVMEVNNAMPNEAAAEGIPMIAAVAALQDWDGVFLFAYSHGNRHWDRQAVTSFFDIQAHPIKMAQMAAGALIFRRGDIEPLPLTVLTGLPPERLFDLAGQHLAWNHGLFGRETGHLGAPIEMRLFGKFGIVGHQVHPRQTTAIISEVPIEGPQTIASGAKAVTIRSVDGRLNWSSTGVEKSGQFLASGERAATFVGFGRGQAVDVGPITVNLPQGHFAAITVSSMLPQPLTQTARILITAGARLENTGQQWNAARTSVGQDWGRPPTLVEPVQATLTLQTRLLGVYGRLSVLDGSGHPVQEIKLGPPRDGKLTFDLPQKAGTIWYLLELLPIEE